MADEALNQRYFGHPQGPEKAVQQALNTSMKPQYQNNANWFQRNISAPISRIRQNDQNASLQSMGLRNQGYRTKQQYMLQNYGDAGSKDANFRRYTPWMLSQKEARERYYIPNTWYNKHGGIKKQYMPQYRARYNAWKQDAAKQGYSTDPKIWTLMSQADSQKAAWQGNTNTQAISLRAAQAALHRQSKELQYALKNAPQSYGDTRRQALHSALMQVTNQQAQLAERVKNLSAYDKFRYDIAPWAAWAAAPGAMYLGGKLALAGGWKTMAAMAASSAAGPTVTKTVRAINASKDRIANAIATNDYSGLTDKERAQVPQWKAKYRLGNDYDPQTYISAAMDMQKGTEQIANTANDVVDAAIWITPWGAVNNARKQGAKYLMRQGWKQIANQTGKNIPGYYGWQLLGGGDQIEYSPEVAAAAASIGNFKGGVRNQSNVLGDTVNGILFGVPGMLSQSYGLSSPQLDAEAINRGRDAAVASYGKNATPQQILQKARELNQGNAAKNARLKISRTQRMLAAPFIRSQAKGFVRSIAATKGLPQKQRRQKLKSIFGGSVSPRIQAHMLDMMEDPQQRADFVKYLAQDPYVLTQILQNSGSGSMAALAEKIKQPVVRQVTQNYVTGMDAAKSKIQFARQYIPLFKAAKKNLGKQGTQLAEQIRQFTNSAVWGQVSAQPWKVNQAMALWADYQDVPQLARFLRNNGAFYGTLAGVAAIGLPLTVSLAKSLFGGNSGAGQAPLPSTQQGALQQGYKPLAYAPKGITERAPIVSEL